MMSIELRTILVFLIALFGAIFILPKLSHIALRIGLVDFPGNRKVHTEPRPLVGGIGFVIAATFSSLICIPIQGLRGYFLGLAVLLLTGFLDDFKELGPYQKFSAQILACGLLIYFSNTSLLSFGSLLGPWSLDLPKINWIIWLVTIFCVVGVINAINMIDGLDGLAGGISFIAFIAFAIHASLAGQHALMLLNLALAGAVLGFLRYNWPPAVLFMGDAGSLCLGFSLGYMSIALTQGTDAAVRPVVALLILAVPIIDTVVVMAKRILRGESPFKADRYHLHHIFLRYGMSRKNAVRAILAVAAFLSFVTLLGPIYGFPDSFLFLIFTVYLLAYLVSSFYIIMVTRYGVKIPSHKPGGRMAGMIYKMTTIFDYIRIFRKSQRYGVSLNVVCTVLEKERRSFAGMVVNISNDGFLARLDDFTGEGEKIVAQITFPFNDYTHCLELPARHLWQSEINGVRHHGFKFLDFDGKQQQVVFKFLVKHKNKD
jgi:UDP-GlcNAc:undecaprenyl-phosphate/decaprenyl-phosphate GlcNAc-1-phosphate transferase